MSDEERVTTDDSLPETELFYAESDEKCPYCKIYKVMADSRLFKVPVSLKPQYWYYLEEWSIKYSRIEEGSNKGCQFCGLLVDATTAWGKEQGVDGLKLRWYLKPEDGKFLMLVRFRSDGHHDVCIVHGTGMSIVNCASPTLKKNRRLSVTVESPRYTPAYIKRHIVSRSSRYSSPLARGL